MPEAVPQSFPIKMCRSFFIDKVSKQLRRSFFIDKVAGLMPATLLPKILWHKCFAVYIVKSIIYRSPPVAVTGIPNTLKCYIPIDSWEFKDLTILPLLVDLVPLKQILRSKFLRLKVKVEEKVLLFLLKKNFVVL